MEAGSVDSAIGGDFISALLLSALFTIVLVGVTIMHETKARLSAFFCPQCFLFALVFLVGNSFGTFVALFQAPEILAGIAGDGNSETALAGMVGDFGVPFVAAFIGVFAFQGVLGNTNITVFGKGVLTIEDWITKAKNAAIAKVVIKEDELLTNEEVVLYGELSNLGEQRLNTFLLSEGADLPEIEAAVQKHRVDPLLFKSQALVAVAGMKKARALVT